MSSLLTSCACCSACQPRYRRLVDSIYPSIPEQGLVKANMQKLTFYAISHPEKLDRIGEYLAKRLGRDLYRVRTGFVKIGVEAMDQLLAACHGSPSLSLFVESFLKMVQKLLETQQPELEVLATESFVKFANIEEDTPSYHRRYDFFISKFSAMCHANNSNESIRRQLRLGGIRGLRGVVRKTVSDELQANIWERQHMEKIVPSLLYNMHDSPPVASADVPDAAVGHLPPPSQPHQFETGIAGGTILLVQPPNQQQQSDEEQPRVLADVCLRELVGKASFGNMKCVLQPVLRHFDLHDLWRAPRTSFAVRCFEAIMYSIQAQYSHVVMQALIQHLDLHSNDRAPVRVGVATVLSRIAVIAVTASIGPSVYDIFNSVLRHLRQSVELQYSSREAVDSASGGQQQAMAKYVVADEDDGERSYQETLINTMGDFANNVPDYVKVEIMMFIIGKVPLHTSDRRSDTFLQHVLMRTLLKVATKYRTTNMGVVFTNTFLEPLLQLALVDDWGVRLLAQQILHTLLDRHQNLSALQTYLPEFVQDIDELHLNVEKCSRTDAIVMKKNGYPILSTLYKSALAPTNREENFTAILCTMSFLCVEVGYEDVIVDLFRLALALQTAAVADQQQSMKNNEESMAAGGGGGLLSIGHRVQLHNLVAKYINVASQLMAMPALCQHVQQVMKNRAANGVHPGLNLVYSKEQGKEQQGLEQEENGDPSLNAHMTQSQSAGDAADFGLLDHESILFDKQIIAEALTSRNYEVSRLLNMPFVPRPTQEGLATTGIAGHGQGKMAVDAGSISVDLPSIDSGSSTSRRLSRRNTLFAAYGLGIGVDGKPIVPLTLETLKQVVNQPIEYWEKIEDEQARQTAEKFRTTPFEVLAQEQREHTTDISSSVARIMQRVKEKEELLHNGDSPNMRRKPKNIFELQFPELFVY